MSNFEFHKPVLLKEMLKNLAPKDGEVYLDATFGAGGYSSAILQAANCQVYAIDRDHLAKTFAEKLAEKYPNNFTFLSGKFSESQKFLSQKNQQF